jgi:hypothetical protein
MDDRLYWPETFSVRGQTQSHQHTASCYGAIGELQCDMVDDRDLLVADIVKPKLHWMQWLTYIIVCFTCLAVCYAMLETYLFIQAFQDWVNQLGKAFSDNLGVN